LQPTSSYNIEALGAKGGAGAAGATSGMHAGSDGSDCSLSGTFVPSWGGGEGGYGGRPDTFSGYNIISAGGGGGGSGMGSGGKGESIQYSGSTGIYGGSGGGGAAGDHRSTSSEALSGTAGGDGYFLVSYAYIITETLCFSKQHTGILYKKHDTRKGYRAGLQLFDC
jgi:hypothetical protein